MKFTNNIDPEKIITEDQLKNYAAPLSETEEKKCKNAIKMIRDAMKLIGYTDGGKDIRIYEANTYAYALDLRSNTGKNITILIQGSYANNTNVKTKSDVDIATILESTFIPEFRSEITSKDYNFTDGTFTAKELKDEVEIALNKKFNNEGVERKDKSIKVHGNSYRVDSDVVPAYRFRDYRDDYDILVDNYVGGIEIRPDSGGKIINYPEQHIKNGKVKNIQTNYYFKKHVRILKKMKYIMQDLNYSSANNVSSFGLESLFWNIPNEVFMRYTILRFTFDELLTFLDSNLHLLYNYKEANGVKLLFPTLTELENYKRFIKDLNELYEYDI